MIVFVAGRVFQRYLIEIYLFLCSQYIMLALFYNFQVYIQIFALVCMTSRVLPYKSDFLYVRMYLYMKYLYNDQ